MSGLPPLPGDPAAVRLLADRLTSSSRRLGAIAGTLAGLRDGATWDGPAGDAFGRRLHEVEPVLDTVALRLGGAAAPLRLLADAMEEAQRVVARAVRDDLDAEHAYAVLEDRAYSLLSAGSGEDDADVLVVRALQREQAEVRARARAHHAAAAERFREADLRCASALAALAVDGLTDSLPYRAVVGASSVGHDAAALGPAAAAVPWLRPIAAGGDVLAVTADAALLVGYGEGDAGALAAGAALAATGGAAGALRRGAVLGARRTSSGVAVTRRLTAQERLRLGAVAEVRQRRDDLHRRFTVPPDRGTPSALLGGPSPGAGRWAAGRPSRLGVAGVRSVAGVRAVVDARVVRARALAGARADAVFRHDWQLATANGVSAQRMYAAGTTLEVATRAGERAVATVDGGARAGGGEPARRPCGLGRRCGLSGWPAVVVVPVPLVPRMSGRAGARGRPILGAMRAQPVDAVDPARLRYPEHLPVVERRDDILAAIRDHQVVVIAGETGSGKTTQLPKMCLELGLGSRAQIGHTQPRRIAARSVAERIAEELQLELGDLVGYQVRFTDHSSDATRVKVMTDGILLNEMQRDRDLRRYDTIIIDEAHERSLNIDFILGYLKQLLPRRPDLKVVVTSATIDPARFARHFATDERGNVVREVPVIEVSGRTFPVEMRYRPLLELHPEGRHVVSERDQVTGVVEAVEELWTEAPPSPEATDILVFFSGEREIRDAAEALTALRLPNTEVLPLYARLSAAEQHRVFHRGGGRRIILATNVAETSLTVPGIGYVVDTGTARISRYSQRTKVQRLPIEPVSRASASQRAGRCGRVAPGVCIRLYSEEDLQARPEFTEPEIQRTSLAAVILQMTALGLGDVTRFPFVDPPDARQVADGVRLLEELGAFAIGETDRGRHRGRGRRLTASGRTLARLPLDPRLARMVVEAGRLGCTREVLVIVAALSIQDPRERPVDKEAQADQSHARFKDERSDFASLHVLWRYLKDQQKALSHSAFRRMCKNEYLHYLRIREWQDLHAQLRSACRSVRIDPDVATSTGDAEPDWDTIHKALLAGLLSHVGVRDQVKREYAGARGARFGISPGSSLFRKQPDVVMAAELVETTRLWARVVARIEPEWAEEVGAHVVTRTVSEPRWSRKAGAAVATERVTLFGVPLVTDRTIQYTRVDPEAAREIFIRSAFVEGDWEPQHEFWTRNRATLERVAELEERARRRDIVVDDEVLFAFYDARIPPDVPTERHFDRWWRGERRRRPDLLTLTEELLTSDAGEQVSAADYPRTWRQGDLELDVTYQFSPGEAADGVTVHVPVTVLNRVTSDGFDWQVPGLRDDLAVALLKSLPKATRRHFVPTPDHATAALAEADPARGPLTDELARVLYARTGIRIPPEEWDVTRVPDHLRITFSVDGPGGRVVARGKDLDALRETAGGAVRAGMARAGASIERTGLTAWTVGTVPETFEGRVGGQTVVGYPALVDEGATVALRVLPDPGAAEAAHRRGVRRLLLLNTSAPWKRVLARLTNAQKLALADNPHGSVPALLQDCLDAAVDAIVAEHVPGAVRTEEAYAAALAAVRTHAAARVVVVVEAVEPVLALAAQVRRTLESLERGAAAARTVATRADVRAQLDSLVRPGFVAATGVARLRDVQRYLRAMQHRLERAATNPREGVLQEQVDAVESAYADLLESLPATRRGAVAVTDIGWMVEELRVSLFAQSLGTAGPVSEKRVRKAIADVATGVR